TTASSTRATRGPPSASRSAPRSTRSSGAPTRSASSGCSAMRRIAKILIANRGEIAARVMRTCRAMGIATVAVYADPDREVPVAPGFGAEGLDEREIAKRAQAIGYPVLVKASAGGGGKGMRLVDRPARLAPALEAARREAKSAFGDDTLLVERYVDSPRHVEIQILGDVHGTLVHCFERECSIQRRHQKIIEEAPSPALAH